MAKCYQVSHHAMPRHFFVARDWLILNNVVSWPIRFLHGITLFAQNYEVIAQLQDPSTLNERKAFTRVYNSLINSVYTLVFVTVLSLSR